MESVWDGFESFFSLHHLSLFYPKQIMNYFLCEGFKVTITHMFQPHYIVIYMMIYDLTPSLTNLTLISSHLIARLGHAKFEKNNSSRFRLREIENGTKSVRNFYLLRRNPKRPLPKAHIRIIKTPFRRYLLQKSPVICFHSTNVWRHKTKIQEFTSPLDSGTWNAEVKSRPRQLPSKSDYIHSLPSTTRFNQTSCSKNYWSQLTKAVKHFIFPN
jgi:hypothetical protein